MRLISVAKLIGLIGIFAILNGCAPQSDSKSVTVLFPDWAKLQQSSYDHVSQNASPVYASAVGDIQILSINASGAGVTNPVPFYWARHDNSGAQAPTSVSIKVPKGALVQVLAVIDGGTTTKFYYGDAGVGTSDQQVLDVGLTNVAATQSLTEGTVVGRYMTSANNGPTGTFDYRFNPPGKPSMIASRGEVFSGWIRAYALSSRLITYTWPDGSQKFDFTSNSDSLLATSASGHSVRSARIALPAGYRDDYYQTGVHNVQANPAKLITAGFFGPYADQISGLKLCMTSVSSATAGPAIPGLFKTGDPANSATVPSNQMRWIDRFAYSDSTQEVQVVDPDGLGSAYVAGGDNSGSCTSSGTDYVDRLIFDHTQLKSSDSILPFRGPFSKRAVSGQFLDVMIAASTATVTWDLLPGVASSLGGVSVFWRNVPGGFSDDDVKVQDGLRCAEFRSPSAFSPAFTEVSVGTDTTTAGFNVPPGATLSTLQVVACPRAVDGRLYFSGVKPNSNASGPAVRLAAFSASGAETSVVTPTTFYNGTCYPISIKSLNANNQPVSPASPIPVTVAGPSILHANSDCGDIVTGSLPIPSFGGSMVVFMSGSSPATITVTDGSASPLTSTTFYAAGTSGSPADTLTVVAQASAAQYQCIPVTVQLSKSGVPAAYSSAGFSLSGSQWWLYPSNNQNCTGSGSNTATFATNQTTLFYYARNLSTGSIPIAPTGFGGATTVSAPVTLAAAIAPTHLEVVGLPSVTQLNQCYPVTVFLRDGQNNSAALLSSYLATQGNGYGNLTITATGGQVGGSNTCVSGFLTQSTSVLSYPQPNSSTTTFYFKPTSVGTASLSAAFDAGQLSGAQPILPSASSQSTVGP